LGTLRTIAIFGRLLTDDHSEERRLPRRRFGSDQAGRRPSPGLSWKDASDEDKLATVLALKILLRLIMKV